jgi:hypothetical protein
MSFFKGNYLRVLTPRTVDGVNLKYTTRNGQMVPVYKETHLPLSARKELEKENLTRPNQVKHVIEEVGGSESYNPEPTRPVTPQNFVVQ